ncbi:hypothetical protein TNCT_333551 [Trichonephila clavata]|uniref:Uncharacterized protein n=1 Tax=Trichonephila clavata TaxID=2740835 RepID=A0A8X6HHY8_TRICU|nr:hypothetical protein TNCT_333551 [Trichonephila clavata]
MNRSFVNGVLSFHSCNSNQYVVAWMHLKNSSHWPCTRGPSSLIKTMSSSFKFGCAICHFLRGCKEERKLELHFFQKPRLYFVATPSDFCGWRWKEAPQELREGHHL